MFEAGHANYVSVGRRYLASMYNAFTCGWAFKDSEFLMLLFGILITSFIYGTLAGVMGTLMMGRAAGDQAFAATMHSLKAWMVRRLAAHPLPRAACERCSHRAGNRLPATPHGRLVPVLPAIAGVPQAEQAGAFEDPGLLPYPARPVQGLQRGRDSRKPAASPGRRRDAPPVPRHTLQHPTFPRAVI